MEIAVRTHRFLTSLSLGFFALAAVSAEIPLLTEWEFRRGDDSSWEDVRIPHDWAITGPFDRTNDLQTVRVEQDGETVARAHTGRTGGLPWIGVGWYRRTVELPEGVKEAELVFDGAMSRPEVYSDGRRIGGWMNGYSPFVVKLPVKPRQTIAVRLENLPESSRWYPGAGLFRPVTLRIDPKARQEEVFVRTERIADGKAYLRVSGPDGERTFTVDDPRLWTPETPHLYTLEPEGIRYGIRTVEWRNGAFELNGRPRKLKGVCLHHDLGPLGAAFNRAAFRRQVRILKEAGCDAIRTAHNIPCGWQLDVCDEEGMMVMAESLDEWSAPKCANGYHLLFDAWRLRDIEALVKFHRNHPSVVMWSIGNEVPDQSKPESVRYCTELQDLCHRLDPTRPVTQGLDRLRHALDNGFVKAMDIPGLNYRLSFYGEAHGQSASGLVLGTETASTVSSRGVYKFPLTDRKDALYDDGQCSSYDLTACSWSNLPDDDWAVQDDNPWTIGEFVWTGFDYLGEPTPYKEYWPSRSSYFGMVDLAGLPKDRYWLYRSRWNEASPTLHVVPHWTWPGREGQVTPVYVYTSYPEVELFVNGKSQGRRTFDKTSRLDRYRLRWNDVVYEPGELKAVAYDAAGWPTEEKTVRTAGAPHHLEVSADRTRLSPLSDRDTPDLGFVTVRIVDRDGNPCPDADTRVRFAADGAVGFKAVCNGDATSLEPFHLPAMMAFHGALVAVVEPVAVGEGRLTVKAEGLPDASCGFVVGDAPRPDGPVLVFPHEDASLRRAAQTFADLWQEVTGMRPRDAETRPETGDAVVFGSECVNRETLRRRLDGTLGPNRLKEGSDGYQLRSVEEGGWTTLFVIGARPRAVFYAVYRFFELQADCAYFWDGDRIPKGSAPDLRGLDLTETPRFDWRGLRYFGHRSLHRFQAEHWTFDDWRHEIDWMLKKRLNFFMLRIGQDDLFQKAFPESCPEPADPYDPVGGDLQAGYNDRRLPWKLSERARLRKAVMEYAHAHDLVHPADTGTMTHWYSRTPETFLKAAQPEFLGGNNATDARSAKGHPSGQVWDITRDKWLDAYWKLTQADVDAYSGSDMFHTIGLSERGYYGADHRRALELKLYAYRRIISRLRKGYPHAPLLIGSWDFRELKLWRPGEVEAFVRTLDPSNTFILDYISDLPEGKENLFTHWGVVGKFPWMFGIFHAYEAHNDMRGNYREIDERLGLAAADPMCRGCVLWPENSHQDTLMLDFFPSVAWDPAKRNLKEFLPGFCRRRYGAEGAADMLPLWTAFVPALGADSWHLCCGRDLPLYGDYPAVYANLTADPFCRLDARRLTHARERVSTLSALEPALTRLLGELKGRLQNERGAFVRRDLIDLARAALSRLLILDTSRLTLSLVDRVRADGSGKAPADAAVRKALTDFRAHLSELVAVLSASPEFSLADSLERLRTACPDANPAFADTLWENADNAYCRTQILEIIRDVSQPRLETFARIVEQTLQQGDFSDWESRQAEIDAQLERAAR